MDAIGQIYGAEVYLKGPIARYWSYGAKIITGGRTELEDVEASIGDSLRCVRRTGRLFAAIAQGCQSR